MSVDPMLNDQHSFEACPNGCVHAVSTRVVCRCPQCDEDTAILVAGYAAETRRRVMNARIQNSPRFALRTFDSFIISEQNSAAYEAAKRVADDPVGGIGIHGPMGVGKSHLAAAIVNRCLDRGRDALFITTDEMLAGIRRTFDTRGGASEHDLIDRYARVPVLAIDDLGKEQLTAWTVMTLFAIVNRRYEQQLPLVITTNYAPLSLMKRKVQKDADPVTYASTLDRVGEMVGSWVAVTGSSRR